MFLFFIGIAVDVVVVVSYIKKHKAENRKNRKSYYSFCRIIVERFFGSETIIKKR
jgi:hypothetical protein